MPEGMPLDELAVRILIAAKGSPEGRLDPRALIGSDLLSRHAISGVMPVGGRGGAG
jgi:hypothetical protein